MFGRDVSMEAIAMGRGEFKKLMKEAFIDV